MTNPARRSLLAIMLLTAVFVVAIPAIATDEAPAETETDAPAVQAPEPAIMIPDDAPDETTAEWPYRFLVPLTLVLGSLAVIGTIFMYFVKVTKNRYRVVE